MAGFEGQAQLWSPVDGDPDGAVQHEVEPHIGENIGTTGSHVLFVELS